MTSYQAIDAAAREHGMMARGGFRPNAGEIMMLDGTPVVAVVVIGNVGSAMWSHFEAERTPGPDPLDRWTKDVLGRLADDVGAEFRHPSDEPYIPMQRWAQRADTVWPSPIGLLIDPEAGLWHAYRGALLFADDIDGIPELATATSPCATCRDRPCLTTCSVVAFTDDGYDAEACRRWVRGTADDAEGCLHGGCLARRACPVAPISYTPTQTLLHMRAFVGLEGPDPAATEA